MLYKLIKRHIFPNLILSHVFSGACQGKVNFWCQGIHREKKDTKLSVKYIVAFMDLIRLHHNGKNKTPDRAENTFIMLFTWQSEKKKFSSRSLWRVPVAKNIYFCPKELFSLSTPAVQNHICSNLSASSVCQSLVSNIQLPFPGTSWQDVLSQIPEIFPGKSITQGADCILECDIREGHLCILIHNICIVLFKHAKHFTHIMLSSKQPER